MVGVSSSASMIMAFEVGRLRWEGVDVDGMACEVRRCEGVSVKYLDNLDALTSWGWSNFRRFGGCREGGFRALDEPALLSPWRASLLVILRLYGLEVDACINHDRSFGRSTSSKRAGRKGRTFAGV